MYVCVCNGLTSRQVDAAAASSTSTGAVYRALGVQPRCGKCIPTIRNMLASNERKTTGAASEAVPA